MEFDNKAVIIGVNLRDLEGTPSPQSIIAEIVLIDRTNGILHPLLYQLRRDALDQQNDISTIHNYDFTTIESNAFAMIGEVLTIDKTKKQIYLKNEITVTYQHLIMASGLKQSMQGSTYDEELSAGLHALMEAIRVRKNISTVLNSGDTNPLGFKRKPCSPLRQIKPVLELSFQNIEKILSPHVLRSGKSLEMMLAGTEKRLYELQL
ncbi:MAG: hypothetical protein ACE5GN_04465 [Waddliaceae bacterium]